MDEQIHRYSYRDDLSVPAFDDSGSIIVLDGDCVLCSGWGRFVLRHDRKKRFRLLIAQSKLGAAIYRHYGLDPHDYQTNILLQDGHAYFKADGTIRMIAGLGFPWSAIVVARIIPRNILDHLYNTIAKNRYRWFGRRSQCLVPDKAVQDRFVG